MRKIINLIFCSLILYAQNGAGSHGAFDPISYGMANTYVVSSRGIYSLGKNPANLAQDSIFNKNFLLDFYIPILPTVNSYFYRNFMTFEELNYYFGGVKDNNGNTVGRNLSYSDKKKFKDIFEDDANLEFGFNTSLLAFSYKAPENIGSFALSINHRFISDITLPKDLFVFLMDNLNIDDAANATKVVSFNKLDAKAGYFVDYNISYARKIPEIKNKYLKNISAGISLKFVNGLAYAKTDKIDMKIINEKINNNLTTTFINKSSFILATSPDFKIKYDFDSTITKSDISPSPFSSPAGFGLGVDIGFSASTVDDLFHFGFAITDIGSVKWDKNIAKYEANNSKKITSFFDKKQTENLGDSLKFSGKYVGSFSTHLPTTLRLGVATELQKFIPDIPGRLLAEFNYNQGFNNELGNSTIPRFSFGFNWDIPSAWAPYIRTGFSFGGKYGFNWAFGLGFDTGIWEFDIATLDLYNYFAPNSSRKINFAIGNRWKF